jgi:riboflavin kinase/FMN adenylyltransferase
MKNDCFLTTATPTSIALPNQPTLVILGMFDGVHLGHQGVVAQGVALAKELGLLPWVFSFASHPKERLHGQHQHGTGWQGNQLTSLDERLHLLGQHGIAGAYCPEFSAVLRSLSPEAFCTALLQETLQAQVLVVGYDFRFGKNREGSADWLVANQNRLGFKQVVVVAPVEYEGHPVSSTRIRVALKEAGNIALGNQLLSRPYCVKATVVEGHRRGGSQLGFPTANLQCVAPSHQQALIPAVGVYSASLRLQGQWLPATVNIGFSPTFLDAEPRLQVEAHLPTYQGTSFYGETVHLAFLHRLRKEQCFDSLAALKVQIGEDVAQTRAYFSQQLAVIEAQLGLLSFVETA